jgi:hypothetical protein
VHTNGDSATDMLIEAVKKVRVDRPQPDLRTTIIHARMMHDDQLDFSANLVSLHHFSQSTSVSGAIDIATCASGLNGVPGTGTGIVLCPTVPTTVIRYCMIFSDMANGWGILAPSGR